jgi:hypothetical protein
MNYLSIERFLVNQERLADSSGLMFQVGDTVSSSSTRDWQVVEFATGLGRGISCLLEQPSTHAFRGNEPYQGNGWQHGTNEQGEYVVRRVMKYQSLFLTKRAGE